METTYPCNDNLFQGDQPLTVTAPSVMSRGNSLSDELEIWFGAWCLSSAKRFVFMVTCKMNECRWHLACYLVPVSEHVLYATTIPLSKKSPNINMLWSCYLILVLRYRGKRSIGYPAHRVSLISWYSPPLGTAGSLYQLTRLCIRSYVPTCLPKLRSKSWRPTKTYLHYDETRT